MSTTKEDRARSIKKHNEYMNIGEVNVPDLVASLFLDPSSGLSYTITSLDQVPLPFPVQPIGPRFILVPLPVPEKPMTPSGIIVIESQEELEMRAKDAKGLVVAVNTDRFEHPEEAPKVGDVVIINQHIGAWTFVKGYRYIISHEMDLYAIINENTNITDAEAKKWGKVLPEKPNYTNDELKAKSSDKDDLDEIAKSSN